MIDTRTGERVENAANLPFELRRLLSASGSEGYLPSGAVIRTNEWVQLQPNVWKAAGGYTRNGVNHEFWVKLWDSRGREVASYGGHRLTPTYVVVNRAGTIAASADELGDVHIWDTRTAKRLAHFRSQNKELYRVAWDRQGLKLGFASRPHPSGRYKYNDYGEVTQTFDLMNRHISRQRPSALADRYADPGRLTRTGSQATRTNELTAILSNGRRYAYPGSQYGELPFIGLRGDPRSFEFVRSAAGTSLFSLPVVVGSDLGELECLDLRPDGRVERRRYFIGHENFVTSISQSSSRNMIATSSTDGTLRIWNLDEFKEYGDIDCEVRGTQVLESPPGCLANEAGIKSTDEIIEFDGMSFYDSRRRILEGKYRPDQVVTVKVRDRYAKDAPTRSVRVRLASVADRVEPLLSVFLAKDGEWIVWTPDGYYDASPHADKYLGFHINQGKDRAALWFTAKQFEQQLYRPEIIDQIISTGRRFGEDAPPRPTIGPTSDGQLASYHPPQVRFVSPSDGHSTASDTLTIDAMVESKNRTPVTDVRLTVNGFPVTLDSDVDGLNARRLSQKVRLQSGKNTIKLVATDRQKNKSEEAALTINCQTQSSILQKSDKPILHVLAVGTSKYEDSTIDLRFSDNDAKDFAAAWQAQSGGLYADVFTHVLVNEDATRENLLEKVNQLIDNVNEGDRVVILFSGHGATDKRDKYYLITHDTKPESLRSTAVAHTDIDAAVEDLLAARCQVLLFVDTCHSGGAVGTKSLNAGAKSLRQTKRDYWRNTGSVVFTSSLPGQESFERTEWENGAFTEAILEAMSFSSKTNADANRDGRLSISELQLYLENRVSQLTGGKQTPAIRRQPDTPGFDIAEKR